MTTLLFGVQSSLPSVPYIKAVDLFMIVSFAAVFVALVEFAVVNYTSMREKEQKESRATKNKYTVVSRYLPFTSMKYYGMMNKSATKRIYPLGGTHGAMRFHPTKVVILVLPQVSSFPALFTGRSTPVFPAVSLDAHGSS